MVIRKLLLSLVAAAAFAAVMPQLVSAFSTGQTLSLVGSAARPVAVTTGGLDLHSRTLVIGDAHTSVIAVRDAGGAGIFQLGARFAGSPLLGKQIRLVLARPDGRILYAGPLSRFRHLALGRLAAGATSTLHASVELTSTGDRARDQLLQGLHGSFALTVAATAA
jgi:hypothetical protein